MDSTSPRILTVYEALTEICARAIAATDRDAVLHQICNTFVERSVYSAALIGSVDKGAVKVKTLAQAGLFDYPAEFLMSDLPEVLRNTPYVCNNLPHLSGETLWAAEAVSRGFLSMAVFPVTIANNIVSLLVLYSRAADAFTPDELTIIEKLEGVISGTLVRIKLDTQKLHAQMDLQRREAIYSRVAERVVGMICEVDKQGIITFVSESQRRILGFEPERIIGKKLGSLIHPQFAVPLDNLLGRIRQTHSSELVEVQMKNASGQYLWVELLSDPVEDEEKRVLSFVIAIRDISSTKKKIERLQNQVNELEGRVRDRTEKIRALNETSNQRLRTAIRQINQISQVKDHLRKNPGFKTGFTLILKSAMRALASDAGGIFVLSSSERTVEARAMIPWKNSVLRSEYQLTDQFPEFESFYTKDPFSRLETSGRSLLGTDTIHCAPILLANRVRGLLALGSNGRRVLDETGLTILKLYSALAADLLRSTSLDVQPAKETVKPVDVGCRLDSGNAYLVPDNVDLAYELFLEAIMSGIDGLCITRTMPARLREKYNLQRTPIIWLTDEIVEGENTIHSLQDLAILISNYVQKATKPVILIDGIEYLISHKGFGSVYHLLQSKRTQMEANQGILIVPIFRDAMESKESKLLEREFRVFGARDVSSRTADTSIQIANEFH